MSYAIMASPLPWVMPSLLPKKWTDPSSVSYNTGDQGGPVKVAVKGKLCNTGPLIPNRPNHCCPIIPIEFVPCINQEETPVLLLGVLYPQETHSMYHILYPCLHATGQLLCPPGGLGLLTCPLQKELRHQPLPSFPNPD